MDGSDEPPELLSEGQESPDVDSRLVGVAAERIIAADRRMKWSPDETVTFGRKSWRPHAVGKNDAVLHVAIHQNLPRYVETRIDAAHASGRAVHVGLTTAALYIPEWRDLLVRTDAQVYVIDDYHRPAQVKRRHVLASMADLQVPVSPEERANLGARAQALMQSGTAQDRGKRLEAFLAFLLSQVADFRVVERNYRNRSQEIDIVIQIDGYSNRVWQTPGAPLILVEAKNRSTKADQPALSILVTKIRTKRQAVRFGILVSPSGFTEDAKREALRYSESNTCVVMVDGDDLGNLISGGDLNETMERIFRRAMMD